MITITRNTIRHVRSVFRRALGVGPKGSALTLVFVAADERLCVHARTESVAAVYTVPGRQPQDATIAAPFVLLADCQGRRDEPVEIERIAGGRIQARWHDQGVPIVKHYDLYEAGDPAEVPAGGPPQPHKLQKNPPELLPALHDAMQITDPEPARYALGHIRLRGADGSLAATDGRQLLVETGYRFPWKGEVLVPRTMAFASPELRQADNVLVGRTDDWVTIVCGPWTFHLRINKDGRFPRVEDHIGAAESAISQLAIDAADAKFLAHALKRLPCEDQFNEPVTVDLNGSVAVRAKPEEGGPVTELLLNRSARIGAPICLNTNRTFLARALGLEFRQVHIFNAEAPVLCRDARRAYVWAVLDPESAIPPADECVRIDSASQGQDAPTSPSTPNRRKLDTMSSKTTRNGSGGRRAAKATQDTSVHADGNGAPTDNQKDSEPTNTLDQALALRDALHSTFSQASLLVRALKRDRKQAKVVRTTLQSLKELQALDA